MTADDIHASETGERDAALVRRVRAGDDEAAVTELIRIHEKKLYRVVISVLINPSDAEEICQAVLFEALRKLNTLPDASLFGPWLLRIGRNRAIDALRSRNSRERRDDQWLSDSIQQRIEADIGHSIDSRIRKLQIEKKLSRLPGLYRSIISLYYWHEMSVDSIADQIDVPAGTVKSYLYRARKILFTELDQDLL